MQSLSRAFTFYRAQFTNLFLSLSSTISSCRFQPLISRDCDACRVLRKTLQGFLAMKHSEPFPYYKYSSYVSRFTFLLPSLLISFLFFVFLFIHVEEKTTLKCLY